MKFVSALALLTILVAAATTTNAIDEWWKSSVFYQIYPRSFKDDNNDGSGDLLGITNKLAYLKETGIKATWLSPIFNSPMVDAGYDISDFKNINPIFGTMEDFEKLLEEAKRLDIRIILDFVPNHSSDKHEWFKKSVKKEGKYTDYYVWSDGKVLENGTRVPPNNWKSLFLGSSWTWNEERQQYYLHQFAVQQPDLNYRSSDLVNDMKEVLRFWLNKGVAGFRVDAVPFLFEDPELRDEPKVDPSKPDEEIQNGDLKHIYTQNLNETFDMVYQWRDVLDEFSKKDGVARVMMTEVYADIENTMRYYGDGERNGASFTFNFVLLTDLNKDSTAHDFVNAVDKWMSHMPKKYTANWVMGNHDQHRTATRHGVHRIDGINMLIMMLPGVGVTYNGEEIGMEDGYVSWEDSQDPGACNAGKDHYLEISRDPERTPFQWNNTVNAGFNLGAKTWLPVSEKYKQTNLEAQKTAEKSHYNIYKAMIKLRDTDALKKGSYQIGAQDDNILILSRTYEKETYILIFNVGNAETAFKTSYLNKIPGIKSAVLTSTQSKYQNGYKEKYDKISLKAGEAIIFHSLNI